jgi:retron-type reverse transcriptase
MALGQGDLRMTQYSRSQKYIQEGRGYTVDIDLEKYFDTVNHDKLMSKLKEKHQGSASLRFNPEIP